MPSYYYILLKNIFLIILLGIISSCGSMSWTTKYPIKDYIPFHPEAAKKLEQTYTVGKIEAFSNDSSIQKMIDADHLACRGAELAPVTENMSIKEYLAEALIKQLDSAGKFAKDSKNKINLIVKEIDLKSFDGAWDIDIIYSVGNKKYPIKTSHRFESALVLDKACRMASANFWAALEVNFVSLFSKLSGEKFNESPEK